MLALLGPVRRMISGTVWHTPLTRVLRRKCRLSALVSRKGSECQSPEMLNGRCQMHGGTSTGAPKGTAMHGSISGESYPPTVVRRGRPRGAFLGCSTLFECCGPLQSVSPWWQETEIGKCLGRRRDSAERAPVRAARAAQPLASSLRQFYWWRG